MKKNWLWMLISAAIAVLTIWAVTSGNKDFSFLDFVRTIRNANPVWIFMGFLCMLGFIFFEGRAIVEIMKGFGYEPNVLQGFFYSSADTFFSAITPSATGGQPVCGLFMMRDGHSGAVVTFALILNLMMYTGSIVAVGLLSFIVNPGVLGYFTVLSRVLIIIGFLVMIALLFIYLMLLRKGSVIRRIGYAAIGLLHRMKLIKDPDKYRDKLQHTVSEYQECSWKVRGQWKMLGKAFGFNLLQRVSHVTVTLMAFLATGGALRDSLKIWVTQVFVTLGSTFVPIPGAMGISDLLLLDGFGDMMPESAAANLELLSRSMSFYVCVFVCGITVLSGHIVQTLRRKKRDRNL